MVRTILIAAIVALAGLPAFACGVMQKAEPRVGSTVASADHLTLTFSQAFVPGSGIVTLTDAQAHTLPTGKLEESAGNTVLSLPVSKLGPGKYKVRWDVLWADCNTRTSGDYKFTVKGP